MDKQTEDLLRLLARIDTDGRSAEHVANLAVMYAEKARRILAKEVRADRPRVCAENHRPD